MDEIFDFDAVPETLGKTSGAEFYLATMTGGSNSTGIKIRLDGDSSGSTKAFKILQTGREPPRTGDRVLVIKLSGTYVVLGKIGLPSSGWKQTELATGATTTQITSKVNSIINMLINVGICRDGNS